jgi:hypothetical protein
MRKLTALLVVLVPTIAAADKDFDSGTGGSYDCGADPVVNVQLSDASFTFTGECKEIHLNGSNLRVTIASTDQLSINGAGNVAKLTKVDDILVNGDNNNIRWRHGKSGRRPSVAANGAGNSIARAR